MTRTLRSLLLAASLAPALAPAQDRPSEEELFGTPPASEPGGPQDGQAAAKDQQGQAPPAGPARPEEEELFGAQGSPNALPAPPDRLIERSRREVLSVGGQLYLRLDASAYDTGQAREWPLASPNLLDVYLDARPNDRVRGFVQGRLSYDPTAPAEAGPGLPGSAGTSSDVTGVLDQLWVNFDVGRTAFVTAGKQHAKWGTGKFWNPTDYLHPVRRDPLAVYDVRQGTPLLKLHLPWEKRGWNFQGVLMFQDLAGDLRQPTDRVGRVAAGGRAEIVLGPAELGLDGMVQDGRDARFGVDVSGGLWDLDLHAEASLRNGTDGPHYAWNGSSWVRDDLTGFTPQVVGGATWSANYSDEDAVTVGAEYFYNAAGYEDAGVYPTLLTSAALSQDASGFQPFYLGQHYLGLYVLLPSPGPWNDTTFTLSVIGNLSDRSTIVRLDHSVLALTYLRVETYVAGHLGQKGGEFRFALPPEIAAAADLPSGAPVIDVGVAARINL
ncbi:MAG: hypothetical protein QM767_06105 [Anaeromyxobacter sp.]